MLGNGFKIFTVRGIEVRLDYSWFIIFVLVTWSLARFQFGGVARPIYVAWGLGIVGSFLFFLSVLLHELGHSFVALAKGIPVPRITLFIFGGAAQIAEEPKSAGDEFFMALAGPAVSVVISVLAGVAAIFAYMSFGQGEISFSAPMNEWGLHPLVVLFGWLSMVNMMLAVFNLIPGFPLDGGRVFRSILWGVTSDSAKSTLIAAAVGRGIAFLFIFGGVYMIFRGLMFNGIWIAFIGWFLLNAATQTGKRQRLQDMLAGHKAGDVMMTDCPFIDPRTLISDLVYGQILHTGRRCFPILEDGRVSGIVTLHNLQGVARELWPQTEVRNVMIPASVLKSVPPDAPLTDLMQMMAADGYNQVPVVKDGVFVGMVTREAVMDFLRAKSDLGL